MKQPTIVFFLFIFLNTFAQDVSNRKDEKGLKQGYWVYLGKDRPETGIPPDGKVEEGNYVDDRKEGVWIKYHEDGVTPKLKGEFKNNRPNGYFYKFHANGILKEHGYFVKNIYLDTLERFFENGNLEFFAVYDSVGKEHGTICKYNPDGSLKYEYEAVHGTIPNPPACLLEPVTPKKTVEAETKLISDNRRTGNGPYKVYNVDEEIWQDGTFQDGKLWDGKEYVYDDEGILLKVKIYKNGVYHSDGQL